MCDRKSAGERAQWLVNNEGFSHEAARQQIMSEYPDAFNSAPRASARISRAFPDAMNHQGSQQGSQGKHHGGRWDPDAVCDGISARDRAQWLVHNEGLSHEAARQQLMSEYPH